VSSGFSKHLAVLGMLSTPDLRPCEQSPALRGAEQIARFALSSSSHKDKPVFCWFQAVLQFVPLLSAFQDGSGVSASTRPCQNTCTGKCVL